MKKIISLTILFSMVLFGSSFIEATPDPIPAPLPPYTMIDLNDPPTCYAVKIEITGGSSDICYYPTSGSVWNMDDFYDAPITAYVSIKWYSSSGWSQVGQINSSDAYIRYTSGSEISLMSFDWDDLFNP